MAKRVPPGEKPFNPVEEALVRSVLQPADLAATTDDAATRGVVEPPVDLGDFLDEMARGASAFTRPGTKQVFVALPEGLYERLKRAGDACGRKPGEFVRLLIERELEGR